jgi:NAD(P)-dependent dehydrogenase (short-subunit alcohol dehydrogenase family)
MHVVMVDINTQLLEQSVNDVKAIPGAGDITAVVTDVSKLDEVVKLREKVLDLHGEIAILMNNVGEGCAPIDVTSSLLRHFQAALLTKTAPAFSLTQPLEEVQQTWQDVMNVNFGGVLNGTQVFAPIM